MDSPKKASLKHLEFQLQREKSSSKDLDEKCKQLQAQIAQLEQDKAELRREKHALADEAKKCAKMEERIHTLQKEIELRDATIASEKQKAVDAKAKTEDVRADARASIASWAAAEEQWLSEQSALLQKVALLESQLPEIESQLQKQSKELISEKDRSSKLETSKESLIAEVKDLHALTAFLQSRIFELEQAIRTLDLAGDKQREALSLKDTEIQTLEAEIGKHVSVEESMEQTISKLTDSVNAAKMANLAERSNNEKLLCDLSDYKKEIQRLITQIDSMKHGNSLLSQAQINTQQSYDEVRERLCLQQDDLKEKCVELRKLELSVSQLNLELTARDTQLSDANCTIHAQQIEIDTLRDEIKELERAVAECNAESDRFRQEVVALNARVDTKDEELVVMKGKLEERLEVSDCELRYLENEVVERQKVIADLTDQLASTADKYAQIHSKTVVDAGVATRSRQTAELLRKELCDRERELMCLQYTFEKQVIFGEVLQHLLDLAGAFCWQTSSQWEVSLVASEARLQHDLEVTEERAILWEKKFSHLTAILEDGRVERESLVARAQSSELSLCEATNKISTLLDLIHQQEGALDAFKRRGTENEQRRKEDEEENQLLLRIKEAYRFHLELQADQCMQLVEKKATLFSTCVFQFCSVVSHNSLNTLEDTAVLQVKYKELLSIVKETKSEIHRKDLALGEKHDAHNVLQTELSTQVLSLQRLNEQLTRQVDSLLEQIATSGRLHSTQLCELQLAARNESSWRELSDKKSSKLQKSLDYEISRKCEYKVALEELKRLRADCEICRAKEKDLASKAIAKANDEAAYWQRCFEELREMVESRKRGESCSSASELKTLRQNAPRTPSCPMDSIDVNQSGDDMPPKRYRTDLSLAH